MTDGRRLQERSELERRDWQVQVAALALGLVLLVTFAMAVITGRQ